jgi:organic radical activating enzyme
MDDGRLYAGLLKVCVRASDTLSLRVSVTGSSAVPAASPGLQRSEPRFRLIYLELTNACNFTCDYCPIDQQTRKKVSMSREFACRIIDEIADNNLTYFLTFHLMGEPYLHKDLAFLTGYAETRGLRVRLLTNGSLLEAKRNEALFSNNLSRLEVGFRTPNDTSFALRLRGGSLTLADYVKRVEGLIEDKFRTNAKTELCIKLFIRSFAAMAAMADSCEHLTSEEDNLAMARHFQIHTMAMARKYGHDTAEWDARPVRVIDGEYPIYDGIYVGFSRIQDFWIREQKKPASTGFRAVVGGCSAGFRQDFGILASGEVTTCCVDYDGKNVIGDLKAQSLMSVLDSAEAKRIKRSLEFFIPPKPFCRECLGGPTLQSSLLKQATTVAIDIRDRIRSRKNYTKIRKRLSADQQHQTAGPDDHSDER